MKQLADGAVASGDVDDALVADVLPPGQIVFPMAPVRARAQGAGQGPQVGLAPHAPFGDRPGIGIRLPDPLSFEDAERGLEPPGDFRNAALQGFPRFRFDVFPIGRGEESGQVGHVEADARLLVIIDQGVFGFRIGRRQVPGKPPAMIVPMGKVQHAGHDVGRRPPECGEDALARSHRHPASPRAGKALPVSVGGASYLMSGEGGGPG